MSEWKEYKLGEVCDLLDCLHKTPIYSSIGYPMVRVTDVKNGALDISNCLKVNATVYKDFLKGYKPKIGDIIFSRVGSFGNSSIVKKEIEFCIGQNTTLIIPYGIDPFFTFYYLISSDARNQIDGLAGGSTQPTISMKSIREIILPFPPIPEQTAIASVLSSLDDKIDLLHRQNATLEKMAETLFRQWFVEEAKEEWEEVRIKDFDVVVTDFVSNGSFASLKENVTLINDGPGYALFIRNTDLKSGFTKKVFVDEHAYNFLSKTKLFGGEVIISSVGDVGSVFRCPKFDIPMTLGNNVVMLRSKFNTFFYLFFNSDYGQGLLYGITSGSVQEKFNKTAFRDITINYPSLDYITEFESLVEPYFNKIDKNKAQIHTLTNLRDTLLPKLMSGEVRVEMKN